jgi:uncharacterized protein
MPEQTNTQADTTTTTTTTANQQAADQPIKFDEWLEKQDEKVKTAYKEHTTGLQNTIKATREERDTLSKELKELLPKATKGSELEKSLTEALAKLEVADKRAVFAEEAVKPEIGCTNPKTAWLIAQADNLFDRRGNPDWTAIKAAAPELFGAKKQQSKANGGAGTGQDPPANNTMNDYILKAAGRR